MRIAGQRNLLSLVELRWLAVGGQLATILVTRFLLGVDLPLTPMLTVLALLGLFNVASRLRSRVALPVAELELFLALLVDVAALTAQLYFSGGIRNPFIFLYLLQVGVASVLLRPGYTWVVVALTSGAFVALTQWHRPIALPSIEGPQFPVQYVGGLLACFLLDASLVALFIQRIIGTLRERDARLAELRQRAAEEEHIVRMGLLASGAAHELGTPLATLSVILGDWARMAPFAAEPELREEMEEMQRQIERCKRIVSGVLSSAGEARAEAIEETTLHAFLDRVVQKWRHSRGVDLAWARTDVPDVEIYADPALEQMIGNVLDNANEASPQDPPAFEAGCEGDTLVLTVTDRGPGFPPQVIERLGRPYLSSKGAPGRGLGLFLAVNVARTLGGSVRAENLAHGARVRIAVPLASLTPNEGPHDGTDRS